MRRTRVLNRYLAASFAVAALVPAGGLPGVGSASLERAIAESPLEEPCQPGPAVACDMRPPTISGLRVRDEEVVFRLAESAELSVRLTWKTHIAGDPEDRKVKMAFVLYSKRHSAGAFGKSLPRRGILRKHPSASGRYLVTVNATDTSGNVGMANTDFRLPRAAAAR